MEYSEMREQYFKIIYKHIEEAKAVGLNHIDINNPYRIYGEAKKALNFTNEQITKLYDDLAEQVKKDGYVLEWVDRQECWIHINIERMRAIAVDMLKNEKERHAERVKELEERIKLFS